MASEAKTSQDTLQAFFRAQEGWSKTNPYRAPSDPPEKKEAYYRQRLAALEDWVRKLPDDEFTRLERLRCLSEIAGTPDDALLREGEAVLAAGRAQGSAVMMSSTAPMQVAEIWAKRGLELSRIPALVQQGRDAYAKQRDRQSISQSDLFGAAERQLMEDVSRWQTDTAAWRTLIQAYSKSGRIEQARKIAAQWEAALQERRKRAVEIRKKRKKTDAPPVAQATRGPGTPPDRVRMMEEHLLKSLPVDEGRHFEALAEIALAEKRKLDALTLYHSALGAIAGGPTALSDPSNSETGRKAANLWKDLGGTNEGWQAWLDSLAPANSEGTQDRSRWTALTRLIPEFSLLDQAGQTWTVARLKGKTTLLNVWATWCGPCRMELPHLQKLHDKVKGREDVQVITLNVDDNTGLVEPFLKENSYTFPVLLAAPFVQSFTGPLVIPTNWISDHSGSLRLEAMGFSGDGEQWIRETLQQLEKIREGSGSQNP